MHHSTRVLESQIDWVTAAVHSRPKAIDWWAWAADLQRREATDGQKPSPFTLGGYTGYRCGRVRYGRREAATLVQLSGDLADSHFHRLWTGHDSLSRLDIAVTVQTVEYEPDHARRSYAEAVVYRITHPAAAAATLVQDSDGGSTCYVGARSSGRFFRCYNKQAESRAADDSDAVVRYARAWRYELELKGQAALAVSRQLSMTSDRAGWIAAYVYAYCTDHGIVPLFTPNGLHLLPRGFRRRSDRDSRLDWLSTTVAPTIKWLLDSTPPDELARRLGLSGHLKVAASDAIRLDSSTDSPYNRAQDLL